MTWKRPLSQREQEGWRRFWDYGVVCPACIAAYQDRGIGDWPVPAWYDQPIPEDAGPCRYIFHGKKRWLMPATDNRPVDYSNVPRLASFVTETPAAPSIWPRLAMIFFAFLAGFLARGAAHGLFGLFC